MLLNVPGFFFFSFWFLRNGIPVFTSIYIPSHRGHRARGCVRTVLNTEINLIIGRRCLLLGVAGFVQRIFVKQVAISPKLFVIFAGLRSRRTEIYPEPGNQQL